MGLCCCRPRTNEPLEEYKKPRLSDIPELHPAVYIELAIPNVPSGHSSSEMSFSVEQVKGWENVVNYDNIITKFSQVSISMNDSNIVSTQSTSGVTTN